MHSSSIHTGRFAAILFIIMLQACELGSTTASRRAEAVVQLLVSGQVNEENLIALTNNPNARTDNLVTDLRTKNTLRYIAGRISQDQVMRYTSKPRKKESADTFIIQVDISERSPEARGRTAVYIVNVHFRLQDNAKPRIESIETPG